MSRLRACEKMKEFGDLSKTADRSWRVDEEAVLFVWPAIRPIGAIANRTRSSTPFSLPSLPLSVPLVLARPSRIFIGGRIPSLERRSRVGSFGSPCLALPRLNSSRSRLDCTRFDSLRFVSPASSRLILSRLVLPRLALPRLVSLSGSLAIRGS